MAFLKKKAAIEQKRQLFGIYLWNLERN